MVVEADAGAKEGTVVVPSQHATTAVLTVVGPWGTEALAILAEFEAFDRASTLLRIGCLLERQAQNLAGPLPGAFLRRLNIAGVSPGGPAIRVRIRRCVKLEPSGVLLARNLAGVGDRHLVPLRTGPGVLFRNGRYPERPRPHIVQLHCRKLVQRVERTATLKPRSMSALSGRPRCRSSGRLWLFAQVVRHFARVRPDYPGHTDEREQCEYARGDNFGQRSVLGSDKKENSYVEGAGAAVQDVDGGLEAKSEERASHEEVVPAAAASCDIRRHYIQSLLSKLIHTC